MLNWLFAEKRAAKHFEEGTRLAQAGRLQAAVGGCAAALAAYRRA